MHSASLPLLVLAALLVPGRPALSDPNPDQPPAAPPAVPAPAPQTIPNIPLLRVVPKGEARHIAFYTALNPDCSPIGPVVIRTLSQPRHGRLAFDMAESFPRYAPGSPLATCNSRKAQGQRMTYEPEDGFEGGDTFRILVINPDGIGYESDVKVSVR
ncbi:hypothetical protein [Methylobacterium nigriterrae]|uniref:hypothetical protein n=1 Tax=Methylobacterium nigriterrae TaxID=3127512 RepID=UPI00301416F1